MSCSEHWLSLGYWSRRWLGYSFFTRVGGILITWMNKGFGVAYEPLRHPGKKLCSGHLSRCFFMKRTGMLGNTESPLSLGLASGHVSGHALWSLQSFMSPSFGTSPGELWWRPEIVSLLGTLATKGACSGFYMAHCWAGGQQSHGAPHGLIRDKTSSFVFVCRIWHDGTAGTGHLGFPCLDNWYVRRVLGVLGSTVGFLYSRFWWSWLHFTDHKRAIGYNPVKDSSRKLSGVNYSLTLE